MPYGVALPDEVVLPDGALLPDEALVPDGAPVPVVPGATVTCKRSASLSKKVDCPAGVNHSGMKSG